MVDIQEAAAGAVLFSEYSEAVADTDVLNGDDMRSVLMGLYGEVGGIMSASKKSVREGKAYPGFHKMAVEEFGDILWYLTAICRRTKIGLDELFRSASSGPSYMSVGAASDLTSAAVAHIAVPHAERPLDEALFDLGRACAALLMENPSREAVTTFAGHYLEALQAAKLPFSDVVRANIKKSRSAFVEPDLAVMPRFDEKFEDDERLPDRLEICIKERTNGRSYLKWQGVFIGDPLSDSIGDPDGYRFHDVFHLAYVAILHWSPVVRSLIKHKRKSDPSFDENEDGGRAIVVEEGLTAWLFTRAKELDYFENQDRVSLVLLKHLQEFVTGYEVSACPLKLWEKAILEGYKVFRQIRDAKGGWVIADRNSRTIEYRPLETS